MAEVEENTVQASQYLGVALIANDVLTLGMLAALCLYKWLKQDTVWGIWMQIAMLFIAYSFFLVRDIGLYNDGTGDYLDMFTKKPNMI